MPLIKPPIIIDLFLNCLIVFLVYYNILNTIVNLIYFINAVLV